VIQHVILDGVSIQYALSQRRMTKRLGIRVFSDGKVRVSVPLSCSPFRAERFLRDHATWVLRAIEKLSKQQEKKLALPSGSYEECKQRALVLVRERLPVLNNRYGFSYKRISIRNQKTRWGSCSKRGCLSFNYRIALLRPELADYLLVHELCHLKEMNHSIRFWTLVAKSLPNFRALRRELRAISLR
jgi:predicted metal-dependent hydrolase